MGGSKHSHGEKHHHSHSGSKKKHKHSSKDKKSKKHHHQHGKKSETQAGDDESTATKEPEKPPPPPNPLDKGTDSPEKFVDGRRVSKHPQLAVIADSKRLWLEHARNNRGMVANNGFEFDVFTGKKVRILVAMPTKDDTESARETDKPTAFIMNDAAGEEVFDFKYSTGNCVTRSMRIEININNQVVGVVRQAGVKLKVFNAKGEELMHIVGVPSLNCCKTTGPDHFKSEIYIPELQKDPTAKIKPIVGLIGRNGTLIEKVVMGEPSGFFFLEQNGFQIHGTHKVYILAVLVSLMTMYSD